MTGRIWGLAFLALTALALAGCAAPPGYYQPLAAPPGAAYAPYDEQTNAQCGALGTCQPLNTQPYAMQGNID